MSGKAYESMDEAYYGMYKHVMDNGVKFVHRGDVCTEVRPFSFTLTDPHRALFTGAARRLNYRFWAAETLMYMAGWGLARGRKAAELLIDMNSNYASFSSLEDGHMMLNPMVRYGDGFRNGLPRCYDTLRAKPGSRQAYVSIWDRDTPHSYEASPCMTGMQFFVDEAGPEARLSAAAHMRSNDLGWGVPYDVAAMCAIQIAMAGALGLGVGEYHHTTGSMHYYDRSPRSGCGPPDVVQPELERRLGRPPAMPPRPHEQPFDKLQSKAESVLFAMHEHFCVEGRRGPAFCMNSLEADEWVKGWCDVVRWSWPRGEAA